MDSIEPPNLGLVVFFNKTIESVAKDQSGQASIVFIGSFVFFITLHVGCLGLKCGGDNSVNLERLSLYVASSNIDEFALGLCRLGISKVLAFIRKEVGGFFTLDISRMDIADVGGSTRMD